MRLIADAMLGRLARWLRALGHDVIFEASLDDPALAQIARLEGRKLLTRDRRLCAERGSPEWCILVESEKPREQVSELHLRLGLFSGNWRARLFRRCMVCNTPLRKVEPEAVSEQLPPAIRHDPRMTDDLRACPGCGRVFWNGSHARRMREWLESVAGSTEQP